MKKYLSKLTPKKPEVDKTPSELFSYVGLEWGAGGEEVVGGVKEEGKMVRRVKVLGKAIVKGLLVKTGGYAYERRR